ILVRFGPETLQGVRQPPLLNLVRSTLSHVRWRFEEGGASSIARGSRSIPDFAIHLTASIIGKARRLSFGPVRGGRAGGASVRGRERAGAAVAPGRGWRQPI